MRLAPPLPARDLPGALRPVGHDAISKMPAGTSSPRKMAAAGTLPCNERKLR